MPIPKRISGIISRPYLKASSESIESDRFGSYASHITPLKIHSHPIAQICQGKSTFILSGGKIRNPLLLIINSFFSRAIDRTP
jgi:hypothetical protein